MGAWEYGVFENDHDLDIAAELSELCGVDTLPNPEDVPGTAQILNSGKLSHAFQNLHAKKTLPKYELMILGACAMNVGAVLLPRHMKLVKHCTAGFGKTPVLATLPPPQEAVDQLRTAMLRYRAGVPWDFGIVEFPEMSFYEDLRYRCSKHNVDRKLFKPSMVFQLSKQEVEEGLKKGLVGEGTKFGPPLPVEEARGLNVIPEWMRGVPVEQRSELLVEVEKAVLMEKLKAKASA